MKLGAGSCPDWEPVVTPRGPWELRERFSSGPPIAVNPTPGSARNLDIHSNRALKAGNAGGLGSGTKPIKVSLWSRNVNPGSAPRLASPPAVILNGTPSRYPVVDLPPCTLGTTFARPYPGTPSARRTYVCYHSLVSIPVSRDTLQLPG